MDHNQPALINAMDSSVNSLTTSFGQLEVDTITDDGPINRLPNEMMQLIMAKLGLEGDVKKLIRLRLVSTRWRAMVEDYCGLKKSLFVRFDPYQAKSDCTSHYFEETFFGFSNSTNFTCLFLSTKISSECLSSWLNMFPNIEQLSIYCYDYYYGNGKYYESTALNNSLQVYINSLDSLKFLDLNGSITAAQLSPALSKLEHFSCNSLFSGHKDELLQVIPHLGQGCVRANFGEYLIYDQVRQWHSINPSWLASLTHLRMLLRGTSEDYAKVVHFLCEHATSLSFLYLDLGAPYTEPLLLITPTVIDQLGKLTRLTTLKLRRIELDISLLAAAQLHLTSLTSVLACQLAVNVNVASMNIDTFTRVLSVILPNLVELDLILEFASMPFHRQIKQYLYRFPKLQKHTYSFY